jgi:hypothetical protein
MIATLLLVLVQGAATPSTPAAESGTAAIRGRIVDKATGAPIARAIVRLRTADTQNPLTARADDEGRYEFTGLPAATYTGFATAGEFRSTHLGQTLRDAGGRTNLVLKDGEVRADVNAALPRALAMTVRVVDEWGEPLSRLRISIKTVDSGQDIQPAPFRTTNDRGELRAFGLSPGRYIVCADSSLGVTSAPESRPRQRFLPTCHPSATEAEATPVRLEDVDLDGVEIQMRRGRTYAVSGSVLDAAGNPASSASVNFTRFFNNGSSSTSIRVDADGRFVVSNVLPGTYGIEARVGGPDRPGHRRPMEAGFAPVAVDAADVDGVVVTMAAGVDVAGRFVFEDAANVEASNLYVWARLASGEPPNMGGALTAHPDDRRVFRFVGVFGKRKLDVANVPRGWYVKSIRYADKEIIDVPIEFKAVKDPSALEIILSSRGAVVTGRVVDERGEPVRGARVIGVSADPAKRNPFEYALAIASSATGGYRLGPRRAGDYVLFALDPSVPPLNSSRPERLAAFVEQGQRVTLGEFGELALDLTVIKPR